MQRSAKPPLKLDYCQLQQQCHPRTQTNFLPGLGLATSHRKYRAPTPQYILTQEPNLLKSAVRKANPQSEGNNSFVHSIPSVVPSLNPLNKKRRRRDSIASSWMEMGSIAQESKEQAKYKSPNFRLYDTVLNQCEVVFRYVFNKSKQVDAKLIKGWRECLLHEDKAEIYASEPSLVVYTHPRVYPVKDILKGLESIAGKGKQRCLFPGEESILMLCIEKYLARCKEEPNKIGRKENDIIKSILQQSKLVPLEKFPNCIKQVETHFKIMATRWKYSGNINRKDKNIENALISGKNNFIDLGKKGLLSSYLLQNSNIHQI